jgi:hypothetical protein
MHQKDTIESARAATATAPRAAAFAGLIKPIANKHNPLAAVPTAIKSIARKSRKNA